MFSGPEAVHLECLFHLKRVVLKSSFGNKLDKVSILKPECTRYTANSTSTFSQHLPVIRCKLWNQHFVRHIIFNLQYFLKIYEHNFSEKPEQLRTNGLKRSETLRLYVPRIGVNFSNSDFFNRNLTTHQNLSSHTLFVVASHVYVVTCVYANVRFTSIRIYSIFSYDYKFLQCRIKSK